MDNNDKDSEKVSEKRNEDGLISYWNDGIPIGIVLKADITCDSKLVEEAFKRHTDATVALTAAWCNLNKALEESYVTFRLMNEALDKDLEMRRQKRQEKRIKNDQSE